MAEGPERRLNKAGQRGEGRRAGSGRRGALREGPTARSRGLQRDQLFRVIIGLQQMCTLNLLGQLNRI